MRRRTRPEPGRSGDGGAWEAGVTAADGDLALVEGFGQRYRVLAGDAEDLAQPRHGHAPFVGRGVAGPGGDVTEHAGFVEERTHRLEQALLHHRLDDTTAG